MTQVLAVAPRAGPDAVLGGQRADARGQSPQRQHRRYARERYLPVLGAAKFEFQGQVQALHQQDTRAHGPGTVARLRQPERLAPAGSPPPKGHINYMKADRSQDD